jgi:hypothetical protein
MQSISPVFTENEIEVEQVIALDQKEYFPIIVLPVIYSDETKGMCVRFELSDNDRKLIAEGADIVIQELTFTHEKFTPISITFCKRNEYPKGD